MFQVPYQATRTATTTAHLAQTMTLLSQNVEELLQQIDSELASNPALELIEERRCPLCMRLLPSVGVCPRCSAPSSPGQEDSVVLISPMDANYLSYESGAREDIPDENGSIDSDELPLFVLKQIAAELGETDRKIAAYILTHLDEDGLLTIDLIEVARYFHVPMDDVIRIHQKITKAEPVGVGSRNPEEAFRVQLDVISESRQVPNLVGRIIHESFNELIRRRYSEIAKKMQVSVRQVQQAAQFIGENLNPYPARSHWGDIRSPANNQIQVYHRPDIIISYLNNDPENPLLVEIIMPISGVLRINPLFKEAIIQTDLENRQTWKEDLEKASLFVKCLQQRNHTMRRMLQKVTNFQRNYILHGEKFIKPLTRVQISKDLEVHESTISRAVSGKTVQLPNGKIVPLSGFFDRSMNIRSVIKEMISDETRPLSDSDLVMLLSKRGFNVARRTVAKYRAMEGILPAHMRNSHGY